MLYLLVRAKVEDYEKWKPGFDEHSATRQERGSKGGCLFRNADDPCYSRPLNRRFLWRR
jgi:hypothetical protein